MYIDLNNLCVYSNKIGSLTNPTNKKNTKNVLPKTVSQYTSPYPTVDMVTIRK